jgi:uncharacterized membrane protein YkvA (DUF1232 family)
MTAKTTDTKKRETGRTATGAKKQRAGGTSKGAQLKAAALPGRIAKVFGRSERRARKVLKDPEAVAQLAREATGKAEEHRGDLGGVFEDLQTLLRLARAYAKGDYRELPTSHIVAAVAAVIYFVSPIDAIPDVVEFAGLIDDVAVLLFVVKLIADDLDAFRAWETEQAKAATSKRAPRKKTAPKAAGRARAKSPHAPKRAAKHGPSSATRAAKSRSVSAGTAKPARKAPAGKPRVRTAAT